MEFLTIWIILAIVGAIVANNKGRSGVGWFFLCLLLTPVVILVFWRCRRSSRWPYLLKKAAKPGNSNPGCRLLNEWIE